MDYTPDGTRRTRRYRLAEAALGLAVALQLASFMLLSGWQCSLGVAASYALGAAGWVLQLEERRRQSRRERERE